jgi:hypothetical protein
LFRSKKWLSACSHKTDAEQNPAEAGFFVPLRKSGNRQPTPQMLALVDQPTNETTTMPAPEDLTVQTPGEALTPAANDAAATPPATPANPGGSAFVLGGPAFTAKHNGSGRWKIWFAPTEGNAGWFSNFIAIGDGAKELAETEADRLNAGGEPLEVAPVAPAVEAPAKVAAPAAHDATKLKAAVLTAEGWLCPESVA